MWIEFKPTRAIFSRFVHPLYLSAVEEEQEKEKDKGNFTFLCFYVV